MSTPKPLTHAERRRIIEAPITFRVVPPKTHAGTLIEREPTGARRRASYYDESTGGAFTATDLEDLIALTER